MKPRVLIVGTAYAIREHRKKLPYLARDFTLTCVTAEQCGGVGWMESAGDDVSKDYRFIGLPIGGASVPGTRCWYRGLSKVFRDGEYDLILVENEPWGVLRWQCWFLKLVFQRSAVFGEFTWENIVRRGWKGFVLPAIYRAAAFTGSYAVGGNRDAAALMMRFGSSPDATACIPQFGVDPAIFSPLSESQRREARRHAGLPEDGFLIAYCGRFVPEKGLGDLLDAFQLLPKAPHDLCLLMMGPGELEHEIRTAAGRDARIRLCPPSTYPEIAAFLQMLDMLVLPSRTQAGPGICWKEQFGHILVEAMACGVVTVGSDSGAIPEVLGDDDVLFPERDVAALAALIQSFAQNREHAQAVGASHRARVIAHYSHERVAAGWREFFHKCIKVPT